MVDECSELRPNVLADYLLMLIQKALENCENCILLGDFNLNYAKKNNVGYKYENFFNDFDEVLFK